MMYPQIVFHCMNDDMMDIDDETMFGSSVGGLVLWVVCLVYCYLWICCIHQIISHCIDDDMMTFDYESVFRSSVGCLMLWVVRLVSFEKLTL